MSRILPLLLGLVIGAVAVYFWRTAPTTAGAGDIRSAYSRALAFYLNETNADDRRARLELLPFSESHSEDPAWLLDMALIDLAELNHPVQAEDHILGEPRTYLQLLESALQRLERARALAPDDDAIAFNLARTYKKLAPHADDRDPLIQGALELLKPLAESDTSDPAALIQYAEILQTFGDDMQAAYEAYDRVVKRGKDFVPQTQFRISEWKRAACLNRLDPVKGAAELKRLNEAYAERAKPTTDALERGAYTKLRELGPAQETRTDPREMGWRDVTARTLLPKLGTREVLIAPDLDGDCARDIVMQSENGLRVLRNRRNATFEDLTAKAGLPKEMQLTAAAVGDLDNDGLLDLCLGGDRLRVFLNRTDKEAMSDWRFEEFVTSDTGNVSSLVLWDLDHDGDLDIFVGGAPNRLYRGVVEETNAGNELGLTEIAAKVGMQEPLAVDAIMVDADDDDDVDLVVAGVDDNLSCWFDNKRKLHFERKPIRLSGPLAAFDVDNDGREELFAGGRVYEFDGGVAKPLDDRSAVLDLDGDGVVDADPLASIEVDPRGARLIAADLNRDGGRDLIYAGSSGLRVYMSRPERAAGWIDILPQGGASNAAGIGTKVRLFAGDLQVGGTCRDGLLEFAVGRRTLVDAVLFRWTNGVEQGVVAPNLMQCLEVEEREGEVGSCPFVYTFDGEKWHFIADVQSGVPLGLPVADGVYLKARTNETILIPGDLLKPVDGRLKVDVTEEFRELFYMDAVVLRAIDHPADVRPVLNEGFTVMSFPEFRVHGLRDLRPPRKATDHRGNDVTPLLTKRDRKHAVVFEKLKSGQYEGLARPWSITLDFGDVAAHERALLIMDGWVEFPTASASIAASQSKTVKFQPPVIDRLVDGKWERIHSDPGFPAGKMKSVLVDLTGKLPPGNVVIRVSSTQRLHWDSFFLHTGADEEIRLTELPLLKAELGFHGVGKRIEDPNGELPWQYSHDDLEAFHRWDQMPMGMLTKYGDVRELLTAIDDKYPILASGDRVRLEFEAKLPPLPDGWVRDWCITTEGWVKDADMNQAVRESVTPLPFHAMSKYPYDEAEESHPHPEWVKQWLTRPARRLVNPEALGAKSSETR
ncbi:MAG: FG-GAP-like repeat-containing protein [Planctomycetota bacterium]